MAQASLADRLLAGAKPPSPADTPVAGAPKGSTVVRTPRGPVTLTPQGHAVPQHESGVDLLGIAKAIATPGVDVLKLLQGGIQPGTVSPTTSANRAGKVGTDIAPNVIRAAQGKSVPWWGIPVDVAGILPFSRGARAIVEGAAAAKAAETGSRLAEATQVGKASFKAGQGLGGLAKEGYTARTLKSGDLTAQLPKARSRITQQGEKLADKASAALEKSPRAKETYVVRLGTTAERVTKAAGRETRQMRIRALARAQADLKVLGRVEKGSDTDIAHHYYAQLPASHRNAEGLTGIRDIQARELHYIQSGQAASDLQRQDLALKIKMSEMSKAGADMSELGPLMKQREEIAKLQTDLPNRVTDIGASLHRLGGLIEHPPPVNQKIIEAVHNLADERKQLLIQEGRLKPAQATNRETMIAREIQVPEDVLANQTGYDAPAYIGHRLPEPGNPPVVQFPSGGTGRVRSPKGVGTENKMVLLKTGRLIPSVHVAAEDWHATQAFKINQRSRDVLGKLGDKWNGGKIDWNTHVIVNPRGRLFPKEWRTADFANLTDNYDDIDNLRAQAEDVVRTYYADTPEQFAQMQKQLETDAYANGVVPKWDELRVVPRRLVDRYYGQFRPSAGRGRMAPYDAAVDLAVASIVFGRVGYIPKNTLQNIIMAVPHQGALLPFNAIHAGQVAADPELRHLVLGEIGATGATGSLGTEAFTKKILGRAASAMSYAADAPLRLSAFMHEAAADGIVPRFALMNEQDRANLLDLLTNPARRQQLNDIRSRSVEAMADFSRLTPDQSRIARRFLIIPGWLFAGSRYPFHFALTHPIRSALLAYAASGEPWAPSQLQLNKPLDQYFKGSTYRQGIMVGGKRFRTNSVTPVGTPWDILGAARGSIQGKTGPFDFSTPTLFDYAQPLVGAGVGIASGQGVKKSLLRLAPNYQFLHDMLFGVHPTSTFPDTGRLHRLERETGVIPINVNDPSASSGGGGGSLANRLQGGGGTSLANRLLGH